MELPGGGWGGAGEWPGDPMALAVSVPSPDSAPAPQSYLCPLTTGTEKALLEPTPKQMDGWAVLDADGLSYRTGPPPAPCHILQSCSPQRASRGCAELS